MKKLIALFVLCLPILLSSCNKELRNENKAYKYFRDHPEKLAAECAVRFPVKDSIGQATIDSVRPAVNVNQQPKIDSLQEFADLLLARLDAEVKSDHRPPEIDQYKQEVQQLLKKITQLKKDYKPCKPDTVFKTKPVFRENTARVEQLNFALAREKDNVTRLTTELEEARSEKRTAIWIATGCGLIAAALIIIRIRR